MEILLNLIGGVAFGFGAMVGISICWLGTEIASRGFRKKQEDWQKEALKHWKKLDTHWEVIASYVEKLDKDNQ